MNSKRWQISRRTMLKGMGAVMSLPLLEAMGGVPARAAEATAGEAASGLPIRMAFLYMPNGVNPAAWQPQGVGSGFELSPTLAPLKSVKDEVLVLTELMNAGSLPGDGHYVKTSGWLTGTTITKTTGKDLRSGGVSVDQLAAQRLGRLTPLPSLELGVDPVTTGVDTNVGYTRLYGSHIAWSTPTTPQAKEINPRLAFDRLFRSGKTATARDGDDRSVLDVVADDASQLRSQLGRADQLKLDNYLDSVRSIEKRIEFDTRRRAEANKMDPAQLMAIEALDKRIQGWVEHHGRVQQKDLKQGVDHTEHVRLMLDIMALAFWSDSTRISTFMFGNAVSPRNFSFLDGVHGGHHEISHHKDEKDLLEQYQKINQWHVEQFAYLLEKLKSIPEGDSNVLNNSMILFGAGMRDGNRHDPHNLPLVLAGKGGGAIKPGRHLHYKPQTPLCNLYKFMLDRVGVPTAHFGDSTGPLVGLADTTFAGDGVA